MAIVKQILMITILFLIGIFCYRKKIITQETNKSLASLVVNIINPAIIIQSYRISFSTERLKMLLMVFLLSLLSYVIIIPLAYWLNRKGESRNIDRIVSIYSNCGFIGIPIVSSLYGPEGVFYLSGYVTAFNLLFWTHGVTVIKKRFDKKNLKKILLSPSIIAVLIGVLVFLLRIDLIDPLGSTMEAVAAMTTPLTMIIAGVSIAQTSFLDTVKDLTVYRVTILRLLVLPLIVYGLFRLIPLPDIVKDIVIIGCACPASTMGTIVAAESGENSIRMSQYFAVTTVLSLLTLPLIQFLLSV